MDGYKYSAAHVQELIRKLNNPLTPGDVPKLEEELKTIINAPDSCAEQSTWEWAKSTVATFFPHLV